MGNWIASLFRPTAATRYRVCMVGLDEGGKTTILYKFAFGKVVETIPTVGFNIETVVHNRTRLEVWDIGGQYKIRALWLVYLHSLEALIYVVDAADVDRIDEARTELHKTIKLEELRDVKVLVYGNKQDQPGALSADELSEALGVAEIKQESHVQLCSAVTGDGLYEGIEWLTTALRARYQ